MAIQRGDESAFAAFYDAMAPLVLGIVGLTVKDAVGRFDVAAGAFVQLWQQAPQFDRATQSVTSWVAATAHARAVASLGAA
ncbi:MAG: hypothetical protein R2710_04560 [Acidimicrobiales bacterium]